MAKDTFAAAVDDSYLLLAFLARRSVTMDQRGRRQVERHAEAIAYVQTKVATGEAVDETDRAAFWESFGALSNLARPMTVGSIRSYLNAHFRSDGFAGRQSPDHSGKSARAFGSSLSTGGQLVPLLRRAAMRSQCS